MPGGPWGAFMPACLRACVPLRACLTMCACRGCLLCPPALVRHAVLTLGTSSSSSWSSWEAAGGRPHLADYNIQVVLPPHLQCYPPRMGKWWGCSLLSKGWQEHCTPRHVTPLSLQMESSRADFLLAAPLCGSFPRPGPMVRHCSLVVAAASSTT